MKVSPLQLPLALRLADLVELTKPRITLMVVLTTAIGFLMASSGEISARLLVPTLLGTLLLAGGASVLNMFAERDADARMQRTAHRPVPAGRVEPEVALAFGTGLGVSGFVALAWLVNPLAAFLGAATLLAYLFVYTPLKSRTPYATVVGAVPGAIPPLLGWSASQGTVGAGGWVLFSILFFWQLPHFYAIAWLYREDYEAGGFAMLSVGDEGGRRTANQTVAFTLALLIASLAPTPLGLCGWLYFVVALILGVLFLARAVQFARRRTNSAAKSLMLFSIVYLPVLLCALVLDRTG